MTDEVIERTNSMKILITNDDGIDAEGLLLLVQAVLKAGDHDVTIVAPAHQCSAMSQRITLREKLILKKTDYKVPGVKAYSLTGTPADCVKVALAHVIKGDWPDAVFSGMNFGYNSGFDIIYSGTVGAAMEGILHGIPSFAFSNAAYISNDLAVARLPELINILLEKEKDVSGIWNVNIPGCPVDKCRGILWDRKPAAMQFYADNYLAEENLEGTELTVEGVPFDGVLEDDSDIAALQKDYISIGRVQNMITGVDYDRK